MRGGRGSRAAAVVGARSWPAPPPGADPAGRAPLGLRLHEPRDAGDAARRHRQSRHAVGAATARRSGTARRARPSAPAPTATATPSLDARRRGALSRLRRGGAARPIDLEQRINECRSERQGATAPALREPGDARRSRPTSRTSRAGCRSAPPRTSGSTPIARTGARALRGAPGPAQPLLRALPRRQCRQALGRQPDPAGAPDRLSALPARMAVGRLAAAAPAQLPRRRARRALSVRRAGIVELELYPDVARARACRSRRRRCGPERGGSAHERAPGAAVRAAAPDRSGRPDRPCPPEGRRSRARARLLLRRARLRADAALRRRRRLHLGRRLPPSYRAQHLGEPGRQPAAARHDRPLPRRDPLSRPAPRSPTRCAGSSRPASRSTARATTASARRSICATPTRTASSSIGTVLPRPGRATPKDASRCTPAASTCRTS